MRRLLITLILAFSIGVLADSGFSGIASAAPDTPIATAAAVSAVNGPVHASPDEPLNPSAIQSRTNRPISVVVFLFIIGLTSYIVYLAAGRTRTSADFYVAHSAITGHQNGWALAGDYMSAASFLGIAGLISLYGYDGFMYSVGWLVAYITILLIVAEPCRNAGKYTMGDILSFRSFPIPVRSMAALSTVTVSTFYLIAQMVGAGKLMELLFGIPYKFAIIGVGSLMIVYVVFGGMLATTWVQIVKAGMIMTGAILLTVLVAAKAGFDPVTFFAEVVNSGHIQEWVRGSLLNHPVPMAGFDYGQRFLEPGLFLKNPLDQISLGMALVLGTAGMPHILMRFFTVPNAREARRSVIVAMFIIGGFYILTTFLGFGAALYVGPQTIFAADAGGNMANILLAQVLGTEIAHLVGDVFLAFLCAVAFATILAVVSGLVLAASAAIAHDIYVKLLKGGKATQKQQIRAARITSFAVGIVAIAVGIAAEGQNVAQLVALAFAVAASGNLPVVVLSLFWRQFNTAGIVAGLVVGTTTSILLVAVSPNMTYPKDIAADAQKVITVLEKRQAEGLDLSESETGALTKARLDYDNNKDGLSIVGLDKPLFPLKNPGILSIPFGFLAAVLVAFAFPSGGEEEKFTELLVRQQTGYRIADVMEEEIPQSDVIVRLFSARSRERSPFRGRNESN
jgi:cation/acetate symporter